MSDITDEKPRGKRPILPVISAVLLAAVLGAQGFLIYSNTDLMSYVADQRKKEADALEQENTYQEDGFKVGEEYEIISTKQISDAYLSGDDSGLSDEDRETLGLAEDVIKKVIKDGMSDYDKEEAIYIWMTKNIGQGASTTVALPGQGGGDQYTPHGVLSGNGAVCVGYATTFRLFMNMLGMDCHIVHNDYHSWDLVQLDDGEWYHVDVYTDNAAGGGDPGYHNFNMDDAAARVSHDWDESALPEAKGVKYTAANQKKKDIGSFDKVFKDVKKGLEDNKKAFYYQFDKVTEDDYPVADYVVAQLQSAITEAGRECYVSGAWYNNEDTAHGYILGLFVETYDETMSDAVQSLSDEKRQSITDAINKAFDTQISTDPYDYGMVEDAEGQVSDEKIEEKGGYAGVTMQLEKEGDNYADEDGK